MKRILMLLSFAAALLAGVSTLSAQSKSDKQLEKEATKEAKQKIKEGWEVMPSSPSMKDQIFKRKKLESQTLENGDEKYVFGAETGTSTTRSGAKLLARQLALVLIAQALEGAVAGEVEGALSAGEEQSVDKVKMGFAGRFAKKLSNVISCVEMYRSNGSKIECSVALAYNKEEAIKVGVRLMQKELEEETRAMVEKAKANLEQAQ